MKASNNIILSLIDEDTRITFPHPEQKITDLGKSLPVVPVFMPFAGCKSRCVFCSQELQTGIDAVISPTRILEEADARLAEKETSGKVPVELAFYGGTFTALPLSVQDAFLDLAEFWKKRGVVAGVRCSTRPDAVTLSCLQHLKRRGVTLVEFGIQSFDSCALALSGRNYTQEAIEHAVSLVKKVGLKLGIQLMPGMPGVDIAVAEQDVLQTLRLEPDVVRLYPCLVIEGTDLAKWWRKGVYRPWALEETKMFLANSLLLFWEKNIPVIRMGVAPSDGLDGSILAGPVHPCLGSMARGRALFQMIKRRVEMLRENGCFSSLRLCVPKKYQGEFFGHRGELKAEYERLGFPAFSKVWQVTQHTSQTKKKKAGIFFHDHSEFFLSAIDEYQEMYEQLYANTKIIMTNE